MGTSVVKVISRLVLLVTATLASFSAQAWHQEASLQSRATNNWVNLGTGTTTPIGVNLPAMGSDGAKRFILLDLNNGHLWNNNEVAIRLLEGNFLGRRPPPDATSPASSQLAAEALQTSVNAAGNVEIAERFRFRVVVRETGGHCPDAWRLEEPSATTPATRLTATDWVTDGCEVSIESPDGSMVLSVDGMDQLALTAASSTMPPSGRFRLRLHGLPQPFSLSAPFFQLNRLLPIVVHVDHRRRREGQLLGCEDGDGVGPGLGGRPCYRLHEGTDFLMRPISVGPQGFADVDILAAAPGTVVWLKDGNFDRCYFNPTNSCSQVGFGNGSPGCPVPGSAEYSKFIKCDTLPSEVQGRTESNTITILQDDGLIAQYAHLKKGSMKVKAGDRVECGQLLALMASSGTSSVPHLHFDLAQPRDFNMKRPNFEAHNLPGLDQSNGSAADGNWPFKGANQGTDELVDPYDRRLANGRATMWTALHENMRPSRLPKLTCNHPSQANASNTLGGNPDGSPCAATNQCRPGRVCSSANICEMPRPPGRVCTAERDCQALSACENGLCTRTGLLLGAPCGPGRVCANALECSNGFCAARVPSAPATCPSGMSMKCLPGCREVDGACRSVRGNVPCPGKACRP